jgi:hypothetical protein
LDIFRVNLVAKIIPARGRRDLSVAAMWAPRGAWRFGHPIRKRAGSRALCYEVIVGNSIIVPGNLHFPNWKPPVSQPGFPDG